MLQKMQELEPRKNVICKTDAAIYVSLVPLGPSGGRRPLAGDSERPWERPLKTLTASDLFGRRPRKRKLLDVLAHHSETTKSLLKLVGQPPRYTRNI
jgi:hypothetical protein